MTRELCIWPFSWVSEAKRHRSAHAKGLQASMTCRKKQKMPVQQSHSILALCFFITRHRGPRAFFASLLMPRGLRKPPQEKDHMHISRLSGSALRCLHSFESDRGKTKTHTGVKKYLVLLVLLFVRIGCTAVLKKIMCPYIWNPCLPSLK